LEDQDLPILAAQAWPWLGCRHALGIPSAFISNEDSELLKVPGFPVAEVTPLDHEAGGYLPTELGMVREADIDI
jgi:hypothetical protein